MDIPNGGFPPFERCEKLNKNNNKKKKGKFFEFTSDTKNVNIRQILEENNKKIIVPIATENELEEISEINN